ncbi:MAG: PLP-dependent aspartate aminotransferase family protein [Anaerolineales bacterium]|jgi:methionine-gamma-lyase
MQKANPAQHGLSTLVNHVAEGDDPLRSHVSPIYQTSVFSYPDAATGAAISKGEKPGYSYTRTRSPNAVQVEAKCAVLEGLDLLRNEGAGPVEDIVEARLFASGMAAISGAIMARVKTGEAIVAQRSLYGGTYGFLEEIAPRLGIEVVYVQANTSQAWEAVLAEHPQATLAYAETPANPTLELTDLAMLAQLAHQHDCWLMVDNTFATPYCQRPLTLGADVVVHSTTKYIAGHGVIIGGVVVSRHPEYMREEVQRVRKRVGGSPGPFDAWLTNLGLKTFELRMARHCENAMQISQFLLSAPNVKRVYYPGLESHPGHDLAQRQMRSFGGMLSFELEAGYQAAERFLNSVRLATLAVSLGNVDTLVQHPAGMTHANVPPEVRQEMGIADGLVRLSVGIENAPDIIADLEQALKAAGSA